MASHNTPPGIGFEEQLVDADGFAIRYLEAGQGEPLILFPGSDGVQFSHVQDRLAAERRLIQFEYPGYGDQPNDRTSSAREMAQTIAAALTALEIETCSLHGTSLGSRVALWLAALDPERVRCLVLESPAAFRDPRPNPMEMSADELLRALNAHPEKVTFKRRGILEAHAASLRLRMMGTDFDQDLAGQAATIAAPILVVFGEQDGLASPDEGPAYARILANRAVVNVRDAAHDVQGDQPAVYGRLVEEFLDHGLRVRENLGSLDGALEWQGVVDEPEGR